MQEACDAQPGTMAAVLGLPPEPSRRRCPTACGRPTTTPRCTSSSAGTSAPWEAGPLLKEAGARRVLPLQVDGAFHTRSWSRRGRGWRQRWRSVTCGAAAARACRGRWPVRRRSGRDAVAPSSPPDPLARDAAGAAPGRRRVSAARAAPHRAREAHPAWCPRRVRVRPERPRATGAPAMTTARTVLVTGGNRGIGLATAPAAGSAGTGSPSRTGPALPRACSASAATSPTHADVDAAFTRSRRSSARSRSWCPTRASPTTGCCCG